MHESIVFCSRLRVRCRRKKVHVRYLISWWVSCLQCTRLTDGQTDISLMAKTALHRCSMVNSGCSSQSDCLLRSSRYRFHTALITLFLTVFTTLSVQPFVGVSALDFVVKHLTRSTTPLSWRSWRVRLLQMRDQWFLPRSCTLLISREAFQNWWMSLIGKCNSKLCNRSIVLCRHSILSPASSRWQRIVKCAHNTYVATEWRNCTRHKRGQYKRTDACTDTGRGQWWVIWSRTAESQRLFYRPRSTR